MYMYYIHVYIIHVCIYMYIYTHIYVISVCSCCVMQWRVVFHCAAPRWVTPAPCRAMCSAS